MRTWMPLFAALVLAWGCGPDEDDEFASAPPTAKQVTIPVPGGGGDGAGASDEAIGRAERALLGTTSEFYQVTRGVSGTVNLVTAGLLGVVRAVTLTRPSGATRDSRTWGPYTPGGLEPLTYRLVVTRIAPRRFTFSVDARPKASSSNADYLALLDGMVDKGERAGTGKGSMTLHFDNRRRLLDDACEDGTIVFVFDNTGAIATNDVVLAAVAHQNPKNRLCRGEGAFDAEYRFAQSQAGAGDFVFAVRTNVHRPGDNKPAPEEIRMRSRWTAKGAGRADVRVAGGEVAADLAAAGLAGAAVTASQCWDASYQTVFETSAPPELRLIATAGDPAACAFSSEMLP